MRARVFRPFWIAVSATTIVCACNGSPASDGTSAATTGAGAGGSGGAPPIVCGAPAGAWMTVANTDTGRYAPGAAVLPDGSILFAGGWDAAKHAQKTAFTFIDGNATPLSAGALSQSRNFVSVAPIPGGLLFAGGFNDSLGSVGSSDVYSMMDQSFTSTGKLADVRELFTTTALPDGRVVAIGGLSAVGLKVRASSEVYDPSTGQWSKTGNLIDARFGQAAVYVPSVDRVLVGGGKTIGPMGDVFLSSLEWYDLATGMFAPAGSLKEPRDRPTASLLPDGRVLFVAGANATSQTLTTTEIFDPATETVSPGPPLATRRMAHAAVTLGDGSVIVAGGWSDATTPSESTATAERLDPLAMQWAELPAFANPRHDLSLLANRCQVFALGGIHAKQNAPSTTPDAIEALTFEAL